MEIKEMGFKKHRGENVLVTGGTGFVGSWCIVELLKRGFVVRTTVRSLSKEKSVRKAVSSEVNPKDRLSFFEADLTSDKGWDEAVAGCDYVLHVASPLGKDKLNSPDELIIPAREGALRVLRAATRVGVKRVVMTSSCAAATPTFYREGSIIDETLWTDSENKKLDTYRKSKVLSELAVWEYMKNYNGPTTLTTILPTAIFGPVLNTDNLGSVQIFQRLLQGRVAGNTRLGFEIIDVRDLADLHIRAMTSEQAAGERIIATGEFMWMSDISKTLRRRLGSSASKVPIRTVPDFVLRFLSLFDPSLGVITPLLGRKFHHTSEKAQRLLNWKFRPSEATVVDCAESLIKGNAV